MSAAAGAAVLAVGCLVLAGWAAGVDRLTRLASGLPMMTPLTAASFAAAGGALLLLRPTDAGPVRRRAGQVLAAVPATAGLAVLAEHATGRDLGVDRLLFGTALVREHAIARPSAHAAAALLVAGLALVLLDVDGTRTWGPATVLTLVSALVGLTALAGYAFGVGYLRDVRSGTGMALHTAVAVVVLAAGTLAARPWHPLMRGFTSPGPGGRLARRLTPLLIAVPFLPGLVARAAEPAGLSDPALVVTVTTVGTLVLLVVVVTTTARGLDAAARAEGEAEAVLRTERDFTRALLGWLNEGIVVIGVDERIQDVNPKLCEMVGLSREELIGLAPPYPWWQDEEVEQDHQLLDDLIERRAVGYAERVMRRPDGSGLPVLASIGPVRDAAGELLAFVAVCTDITQIKRADARTEAIIETAGDAFVSIDPAGVVTAWNRAAQALFGWSREQAVGRPLADLILPPESREAHRAGLARVAAGAPSSVLGHRVELTGLHCDGRRIPLEVLIWTVETGTGPQFYAFLHDIGERLAIQAERERMNAQAEREHYERRLQQSQRLESLGQLAGGVAHDFNNLLAVILNYLGFIGEQVEAAERAEPERWAATRVDVGQVHRAAERAARLTRQLLTFGRRDIAQPEVLDLNEVVAEVEQLLLRTLGEHVALVTMPAPDLRPVLADPGQIEQVLVNLAVNARDAMPEGGTLTIDTANLDVDADYAASRPVPPGRFVRLRVSDTGVGMPKDVSERAFEPFFTTKPKGEGTGLGLATVYGILTAAGGHVQIYSEPGMGTTISLLLPATDQEAATEAAAPVTRPRRPAAERTVLLVEDEEALREITSRMLRRHGYQVLVAADGAEAVELAGHHGGAIDLLLTDVVMPGMFGKEVAGKVQAARPEARVLYMSGYAQPVLAGKGTLEPGVALLEKPFTEAQLLELVDRALAGDHPAD